VERSAEPAPAEPDLTSEQLELLSRYEQLLLGRGIPLGVVAESDRDRLHERHIQDSLRCVPLLPERGYCVDLGSGGGLPGVVVAIAKPDLRVGLVERRSKRAGFLELVIRTLGLGNAGVVAGDVSDLEAGSANAATARAFAPLPEAWRAARDILAPAGCLVYFAGASLVTGLEEPEGSSGTRLVSGPEGGESGPLVIITR